RPLPGTLTPRPLADVPKRAVSQVAFQVLLEGPGRRITVGRLRGQALADDGIHPGRDRPISRPRGRRPGAPGVQHPLDHLANRPLYLGIWTASREQFE